MTIFYSQKEDAEESGSVSQVQPWKTNKDVASYTGFVRNDCLQTDLMKY